MPDPKSPLSLAVDAEVKKPGVMRELLQMAKRLSRSEEEEDWKDLVAMTLLRVVNPADDPWQPGRHSFLAHMHGSMRQARHRERRKLRTKGEVYDGGVAQENTAGDTPGADDELERSRSLAVLRKLGDRLLARLEDNPLARQICETGLKEDLEPAEEEKRFHRTHAEIKAAHDRIKYHAGIVLNEWNASEERRMKALRERATDKTEEDTP